MTENIAQTVQKAIQDLVAPDVRELKVQLAALQKQMDLRFEGVNLRFDDLNKEINQRFEAQSKQSEAQFKMLMAALGEFKAQSEIASLRVIASLSERVAVLEARQH